MNTILVSMKIICGTFSKAGTLEHVQQGQSLRLDYFILLDMFMYPVPKHDNKTVLPNAISDSLIECFLSLSIFIEESSLILKVTPNASRSSRSVFMD